MNTFKATVCGLCISNKTN